MSSFRRVITGHDAEGRSIIASDAAVQGRPVPGMSGVELTTLWGSDQPMDYPDDGSLPDFRTWFAPVGGFRFIEFVVGPDQDYYFLEMNTRIQVEHPVTEMRTGVDLVAAQVHFARGDAMPDWFTRGAIEANGHTIECRVYAERPEKNFLPSPGTITDYATPALSLHVRVDSGVRVGDQITFHYDPMIAKVIVHGATRDEAIDRMRDALTAFRIEGVYTNIPFLIRLMDHADFRAGRIHTTFLQGIMADLV